MKTQEVSKIKMDIIVAQVQNSVMHVINNVFRTPKREDIIILIPGLYERIFENYFFSIRGPQAMLEKTLTEVQFYRGTTYFTSPTNDVYVFSSNWQEYDDSEGKRHFKISLDGVLTEKEEEIK